MPRRAGKAASRKARQRSVKRASRPASPAPSAGSPPTAGPSLDDAVAVPPVGTPDAREAASLRPRRRTTATASPAGSTLTSSEKAEYHYVERDLRNIAILTAGMAVLLLVAWLAFSAMGLVG